MKDPYLMPLPLLVALSVAAAASPPAPTGAVFRCPLCDYVSASPHDRRYGFCSACGDFTGAPAANDAPRCAA